MKILLTNDDGYNAEGIKILYAALQRYGQVTVIAPNTHQSAKSASLTLNKEFELAKHAENIYSLDGTPADCVSFATRHFATDWDLVVSGCNDGLNIAYDTCYSGTIGAAIEANIQGFKTICISNDVNNFALVKKEINAVFEFIFANKLASDDYILSVNFPTNNHQQSKGYRLATLGNRDGDITWQQISDNIFKPYRAVRWESAVGENNDSDLCQAGYITFTPLTWSHLSVDNYHKLKTFFAKNK